MPTSPAMILLLAIRNQMQAPLKARPQMPLWLVRMFLIGRTSLRPPVRGLPPKRRSWLVPKWSGSRSQIRSRHPGVTETGVGQALLPQRTVGLLSAAHPQVVAVFGILDVVTNREVAVVPAPRTEAWAKSLRSTGGSRTTQIVNSDCRNPKASSTAFAGMSARKMSPPVKRPRPSSRPVALPPFSLRWC